MGTSRTAAQRVSYAVADGEAGLGTALIALANEHHDEVRQWARRLHAAARVHERFGVVVDTAHLLKLGKQIETGVVVQPGLMLIGHASDDRRGRRTSLWLAWIGEAEIPFVYDHDARSVVTVLPWTANQLRYDRRRGGFPNLARGGTKAARTYWAEVRS